MSLWSRLFGNPIPLGTEKVENGRIWRYVRSVGPSGLSSYHWTPEPKTLRAYAWDDACCPVCLIGKADMRYDASWNQMEKWCRKCDHRWRESLPPPPATPKESA